MKRHVSFFSFVSALIFSLPLTSVSANGPNLDPADTFLREPVLGRSELRHLSLQLARTLDENEREGVRDDGARADALVRMIRSWRAGDSLVIDTSQGTIAEACYPDALLASRLPTLWSGLWDTTYASEKARLVENTPLGLIFDGLLGGYIDGSLPEGLAQQAKAIGKCVAKRALVAHADGCTLDESSTVIPVSNARLAWIKLECGMLNFTSACGVRETLFNALKPELIRARDTDPTLKEMIAATFEKQFPEEFRREFLKEMREKRSQIPNLISAKFNRAAIDPLWSSQNLLIEPEDRGSGVLSLRAFARALEAEVITAALLHRDSSAQRRGVAAALFYSAANRLLTLTGGTKVTWDSRSQNFLFDPRFGFNPAEPRRAPVMQVQSFGGFGVGLTAGLPSFLPWDWSGYDPLVETELASRIRLFPNRWKISATGAPQFVGEPASAVQNLGDLGDLMAALNAFLRETSPRDGAFAQYFGPESQAADLLDPEKPLIFPSEGRVLAIGVLAGILKNVIAPVYGHLIVKQQGSPDFGLGIELVENVDLLRGRRPDLPTTTEAVARVLSAAGDLRETLREDPDVPSELRELLPRLDEMQQVGAIYLGAKSQLADGGFTKALSSNAGESRRILDTLVGLQALSGAWNKSEILLILVRIHQGWVHLENRWPEIERLIQSRASLREIQSQGFVPSELWQWLRLWKVTQPKLRQQLSSGLSPVISWEQWDQRMLALETALRTYWDPTTWGGL